MTSPIIGRQFIGIENFLSFAYVNDGPRFLIPLYNKFHRDLPESTKSPRKSLEVCCLPEFAQTLEYRGESFCWSYHFRVFPIKTAKQE